MIIPLPPADVQLPWIRASDLIQQRRKSCRRRCRYQSNKRHNPILAVMKAFSHSLHRSLWIRVTEWEKVFELTSTTFFCWSGNSRCDAFSEKLRLIISSTRKASTRSKFKIMLYVNRNWEISLAGVPSIMVRRVVCWWQKHQYKETSSLENYLWERVLNDYDDGSCGI